MVTENQRIKDLVTKLQSPKSNDRYMACEYLRAAPEITPEAIEALQLALHDPNEDVKGAARRALNIHLPPEPVKLVQEPIRQLPENMPAPSALPTSDEHFTYSPVFSPMPNTTPSAPEYILSLEKRIMILEVELGQATKHLLELQSRTDGIRDNLPETRLLSRDYFTRAFAVWGHEFVAGFIISLPFACIYAVLFLLGLVTLGNQ